MRIYPPPRDFYQLIIIFIGLFSLTVEDNRANDVHARKRRSNIPCGSSFTPCNRRPAGFIRPFETNQLERRDTNQFVTAPNIRRQMVSLATQEAKDDVDRLFNQTEPFLIQNNLVGTSRSSQFWATYRKTYPYAKDLSYSALVSIGASQRLRSFGLQTAEIIFGLPKTEISGTVLERICPPNPIQECVPGKYRTYSGHCNNVNNPLWGAAFEPLQRYLAPDYSDEVSAPRVAGDGTPLPNARQLSVGLFRNKHGKHRSCTMMLAQWGQFIYNDIVQLSSIKGQGLKPLACCDSNVQHPECMTIAVARDDPGYQGFVTCLPYSRTGPAPRENCLLGPREQGNQVTSFIDGSGIYGSQTNKANELRSFVDGKLQTSHIPFLQDLLPAADFRQSECNSIGSQPCFKTGSDMANFLPTLTAIHTIWTRQHNRLADQLKNLNQHWDDERLYQEARRIVGAQIQQITYNEFLPVITGMENMQNFGLEPHNNGYYSDYNLEIDPSVINSYASAVGLFFFTLFPDTITLYTKGGDPQSKRPLNDMFFNPGTLYFQGRLDSIVRFLIKDHMENVGIHMNEEFRQNFLKGDDNFGLDLAALIIQIGRDHGIPSYTVWRTQCGLKKPANFDDLTDILSDPTLVGVLQKHYKNVDDVDLFVLGLAEKPVRGALLGPTFACIMAKQFQKLRRGDRFWYENFFFPSAFNEGQINEIRKITLSRIICDNTDDLGKIQPFVLNSQNNFENCPVSCNSTVIDRMDLSHWMDSEPKLHLPITQETLDKAVKLGAQRAREIQEREGNQIRLRDPVGVQPGDALFSHSNLLSAKRESLDIARTANVLLETTKVLIRGDGLNEVEKLPRELDMKTLQQLLPQIDVSRIIGNLSENNDECVPQFLPCDHTTPYRTYAGFCNNLLFPQYGNAFSPFRRLLDPAYDDGMIDVCDHGFDEPRTLGVNRRALPTTRAVSNAVHGSVSKPHIKFSHMLMQFGQFLDHDMTLAPMARDGSERVLNCSSCNSREEISANCFPIQIPNNDRFFPSRNPDGSRKCIPFTRSLLGQLKLGYRNQINQITSFIDASNVYGSTECEANKLRLFSMGKMNFTERYEGLRDGLPQGNQEKDCRSAPRHPCFVAGDERNNEQPGLVCVHTIFVREHNRIATRLHRINNFWPDEKIYQETRRIVGAIMQHIAFNEFLPKILGCETAAKYDLVPRKTGYYNGYDPRCDPSISNSFSAAAFRFGHTLIRSTFPRMDDFFHNFSTPVELKHSFLNTSVMYDGEKGGMDTILIGLIGIPAEGFDRHISSAVRNHLFQHRGQKFSGMDLPAINMQRGRDHGLPPYNQFRELCGMRRARNFNDLQDTTDSDAIRSLRSVYRNVDDIDLFPGLITERPMQGALVGPTTACILAEQFQRLRRCDRFWYENDLPETRFTPDQLAQIRKVTFAKVLCGNSQFIRMVQPRVFDVPDDLLNAQLPCQDLHEIDLYEWLDRQFCVVDHRVINLGKTKRITPCVSCTCTAEGPECHSIRIRSCVSLLDEFLFSEVMEDTVCVIQCSGLIKRRAGRV